MKEISHISVSKITSRPRVSLEGIQEKKEIQPSLEMSELKQLELDIEKAISLAQEIRNSLESQLRNLTSD